MRAQERQRSLSDFKTSALSADAPLNSTTTVITTTQYTSPLKQSFRRSSVSSTDESDSDDELTSSPRKTFSESTTKYSSSVRVGCSSVLCVRQAVQAADSAEVFTLRQQLIDKSAELEGVRRELDRVLVRMREKETLLEQSESAAARKAQVWRWGVLLCCRVVMGAGGTELVFTRRCPGFRERVSARQAERARRGSRHHAQVHQPHGSTVAPLRPLSMVYVMVGRLQSLHGDLERAEQVIDSAREESDRLEHDMEVKLSLLEQVRVPRM